MSIVLGCLCPAGRKKILHVMTVTRPRNVSDSPYGRAHVWKQRRPKLPNPIVPLFPQRVTLSDGSTFTQYTTSPRSSIRLTRDVTNHPMWNYGTNKEGGVFEDEEGSAGRLGRFKRKFEELGGNLDWVAEENPNLNESITEAVKETEKATKK